METRIPPDYADTVKSNRVLLSLFAAGALAACSSSVSEPSAASDVSASPEVSAPEPVVSEAPAVEWDFFLGSGGQSGRAYREALALGDDATADLLADIALVPQAEWYGAWQSADLTVNQVEALLEDAAEQGKPAVFVVYAIPNLDCATFSEGGLEFDTYVDWVATVAAAIDGHAPYVILEPDALGQLGMCEGQGNRTDMLAEAAELLDDAGARVYLDAGNAEWLSVDEAVTRIDLVGTEHLAGFALNVSNFVATDVSIAYGDQIAEATGLTYVIDTSRNGNGWNGEWCNPPGRALGETPQLRGEAYLDALLWVKRPGESDGPCQGGPNAGTWWIEYAIELAQNARANTVD